MRRRTPPPAFWFLVASIFGVNASVTDVMAVRIFGLVTAVSALWTGLAALAGGDSQA